MACSSVSLIGTSLLPSPVTTLPPSSSHSLRFSFFQTIETRFGHSWRSSVSAKSEDMPQSRKEGHGRRRIWRRRKLTKKDNLDWKMQRVPFLEEKVRTIREEGSILSGDIERLLLSEDNRFEFVNKVAAEAKEYVESNPDEYGFKKKAILHVLSNRMNEAGFSRTEAYAVSDPFKPPGPENIRIIET